MTDETEGADATSENLDADATLDGESGTKGAEDAAKAAKAAEAAKAVEPNTHFSDGFEDVGVRKLAARYTSDEELAKALREANIEVSKRLKVPGKDADEDTLEKFRHALGVPDTVEGYDIQKPGHLEADVFESEAVQGNVNGIVTAMHGAGATKGVVDATMAAYWAMEAATQEAIAKNDKEAAADAETSLRKDWGKNYDGNVSFAEAIAQQNPELSSIELKDGTLLSSNPYFIKLAATHGRITSEGSAQAGLNGTEAGVDLKTEHARLTTEIYNAQINGDNALAQKLDAERTAVSEKLYGTASIVGDGRSV